jgi:hypothetical protein
MSLGMADQDPMTTPICLTGRFSGGRIAREWPADRIEHRVMRGDIVVVKGVFTEWKSGE